VGADAVGVPLLLQAPLALRRPDSANCTAATATATRRHHGAVG
jgi:hypothetical protein